MFVRNVLSFLSNVIPISYKGEKYDKFNDYLCISIINV